MRTSLKTLGLAATLLTASAAHAADKDATEEPTSSPHKYYLGIGTFNEQLQGSGEYVTEDWGNFVYRVGKLKDKGNELLQQVAWRTPLVAASGHDSGYYVGAFAGQLQQTNIGGNTFRLLGAGVDLGYHWVSENTRSVASVGLGTTQEKRNNGINHDAQPTLFFNFSIALGL